MANATMAKPAIFHSRFRQLPFTQGRERLLATNGYQSCSVPRQAAEIVTELRASFAIPSKCGPDGQNVLEASSERQEFSSNTPNMLPFLCLSLPPCGLWTIHRRVGVRHGRVPRTKRTD